MIGVFQVQENRPWRYVCFIKCLGWVLPCKSQIADLKWPIKAEALFLEPSGEMISQI